MSLLGLVTFVRRFDCISYWHFGHLLLHVYCTKVTKNYLFLVKKIHKTVRTLKNIIFRQEIFLYRPPNYNVYISIVFLSVFENMLIYFQDDLIGKSVYNIIHVGDHAQFSNNLLPMSVSKYCL